MKTLSKGAKQKLNLALTFVLYGFEYKFWDSMAIGKLSVLKKHVGEATSLVGTRKLGTSLSAEDMVAMCPSFLVFSQEEFLTYQ